MFYITIHNGITFILFEHEEYKKFTEIENVSPLRDMQGKYVLGI